MTSHHGDRSGERHDPDPGVSSPPVSSPPVGYRITRTYPAVGGGRLQPYRLAEPANYACVRCWTACRRRALTVIDGDWLHVLCPSCTKVLAPVYERAAKDR